MSSLRINIHKNAKLVIKIPISPIQSPLKSPRHSQQICNLWQNIKSEPKNPPPPPPKNLKRKKMPPPPPRIPKGAGNNYKVVKLNFESFPNNDPKQTKITDYFCKI